MKLSYFIILIIITGLQSYSNSHHQRNSKYWKAFDTLRICRNGKHQSPINIIESQTIVAKKKSKIIFKRYNIRRKFVLTNEGTTAALKFADRSFKATVTSPHLNNDTFQFDHLHFHLGSKGKGGSEHLFDGTQASMEAHFVHFNTKYGKTFREVLATKGVTDSIGVLAVRYGISSKPNDDLEPMIRALKFIRKPEEETVVTNISLKVFLPEDVHTFFAYSGSLTTPRCQEVVSWTVFKEPNNISKHQLDKLRKIRNSMGPIVNNFRSPQPLNGREVVMYSSNGP